MSSGRSVETLIPWNVETLRQDYGKSYLACIPKYDGFCTVPDHTNYRREIDGFLNRYEPIPFQPAEGIFPHIHDFLAHIFGEQVELGDDYLQLLYLRPLQRLLVLLLVSDERNTGKTTFLNLLKSIFDGNVTFNTNEDLAVPSSFDLGNSNKFDYSRFGVGSARSSMTTGRVSY